MRSFAPLTLVLAVASAACGGSSPLAPSSTRTATLMLAGAYRFTITPSAVCSWPVSADTRLSWDIDITTDGNRWVANFPHTAGDPNGAYGFRVGGTITGNTTTLDAYVAAKSGSCWLDVHGAGSGEGRAGRVAGPFDGSVENSCANDPIVRCAAVNHGFVIEPR